MKSAPAWTAKKYENPNVFRSLCQPLTVILLWLFLRQKRNGFLDKTDSHDATNLELGLHSLRVVVKLIRVLCDTNLCDRDGVPIMVLAII